MKASLRLGRQDYYLGGHPLWEFFRACYPVTSKPYLVGGRRQPACGLLLRGGIRRMPRPVSAELMQFHRREQMQWLFQRFRRRFSARRLPETPRREPGFCG